MKSIIHKWVVNVIPVTGPTQYTKLGKEIVKTEIRLLSGIPNNSIPSVAIPPPGPTDVSPHLQAGLDCP